MGLNFRVTDTELLIIAAVYAGVAAIYANEARGNANSARRAAAMAVDEIIQHRQAVETDDEDE